MTYVGGNRTWRNQNPGDLGTGRFTNEHGAIGKAGGFAVFPNYETGRKAIFALLKTENYQQLSIWDAIPKYAPVKDNNVAWYRKLVRQVTGLDLKRKVRSLSPKELESLVNAIEQAEGKFIPDKIIKESKKRKITSVRKNKKGTIVGYLVEGLGWLSKPEAIQLASKGKIDAVVAHSRAGNLYLKTRPDWTIVNNLNAMG